MANDTPKPSERIRAASTPKDALLVIGEILDELAVQSDTSTDPWLSWGQDEGNDGSAESAPWSPDPADEALLAELQEQLRGNDDADESRVLRAKIELVKDRLVEPPDLIDNSGNATETHYDDEGNAIVDLPPPTPAQIDERAQILPSLGLQDQYGEEVGRQAEDSFVRGGPLLLYLSDREYVNSLPHNVKLTLVADVEQSSPREAHEMARDILKADTDTANDLQAAQERIFGDAESGAIHNAP